MWSSIATLESFPIMITLVLFMLLICILLSTFSFIKSSQTRKSINLPPSPPNKLPIIGHLHQLGLLPHHPLQSLAQKHGPLMLLHLGLSPTLVVSSPQAAKEIMKTHDLIFSSRPNQRFAEKLFYGKDLAFAPYSEYWRHMRKIYILQLLSAKRVQSFRSVREEEVEIMIKKISATSCNSSDQVVNLSQIIVTLTNDIICRIALGRKYSGEEVARRSAERTYLMGVSNVGDFIPWLCWINHLNGLNVRVEELFKETDCFLEGVVEEHIVNKNKREGITHDEHDHDHEYYKEDFVDVLLGINDFDKDSSAGLNIGGSLGRDNIKAIILDMFAGGTDTSRTVLEWAISELIRHPKVMKRAQEEVREIANGKSNITEDDLNKMNYLQCIIKETLRLHPPAPLLVPRESTEASKIQGYDIPANTRVSMNTCAI